MNLNQFKNELGEGARPNLYKVTIGFPLIAGGSNDTRKLSFLCKAAQLPGVTTGTIEAPFMGRQSKLPGDLVFEEWTITVFLDAEFKVRDAFERWSNAMRSHRDNVGLDLSEILADGTVEQLNRQQETIKTYDIREMFPSNLSPVELAYDTNDTIGEFTVTLQYQYWESQTTS